MLFEALFCWTFQICEVGLGPYGVVSLGVVVVWCLRPWIAKVDGFASHRTGRGLKGHQKDTRCQCPLLALPNPKPTRIKDWRVHAKYPTREMNFR